MYIYIYIYVVCIFEIETNKSIDRKAGEKRTKSNCAATTTTVPT
jgi:hypothetical protein